MNIVLLVLSIGIMMRVEHLYRCEPMIEIPVRAVGILCIATTVLAIVNLTVTV